MFMKKKYGHLEDDIWYIVINILFVTCEVSSHKKIYVNLDDLAFYKKKINK